MNAKDCAKFLKETVHKNSFCAYAYVIKLLGGDQTLFREFLYDLDTQGLTLKEIYVLNNNAYNNRVTIVGALHVIEAILRYKIPVQNIIYEYEQLKRDKQNG